MKFHSFLLILCSTVLLMSCSKNITSETPIRSAICTDSGSIQSNSVVTLNITETIDGNTDPIHVSNTDGEVIRIGSGRIPKMLEKALIGMKPNETLDITLKPADAYGELTRSTDLVRPAFGPDAEKIKIGSSYEIAPGLQARVTDIAGEIIKADVPNEHPLAGKTIHYHVLIKSISSR